MNYYPGVSEAYLPNGLRILVNHLDTDAQNFMLVARQGSFAEKPELAGATHYLEHMIMYSWAEPYRGKLSGFREDFEVDDVNMSTNTGFLTMHANGTVHGASEVFRRMLEGFVGQGFTPDDVERERNPIVEEMASTINIPGEAEFYSVLEQAFSRASRFALHSGGMPDTLKTITHADLVATGQSFLNAEMLTIVASGGMSMDRVIDLAAQAGLAGLTGRPHLIPTLPTIINQTVRTSRPGDSTSIEILYDRALMDGYSQFALGVCIETLQNRLHKTLREDLKLVYSARPGLMSFNPLAGFFSLVTACDAARIENVIERMAAITADLPRDHDAIDRARTKTLSNNRLTATRYAYEMNNMHNHMIWLSKLGLPLNESEFFTGDYGIGDTVDVIAQQLDRLLRAEPLLIDARGNVENFDMKPADFSRMINAARPA